MKKRICLAVLLLSASLIGHGMIEAKESSKTSDITADQAQKYLDYIGKNLKNRSYMEEDGKLVQKGQHAQTIKWINQKLREIGISPKAVKNQKFTNKYVTEEKHLFKGNNIIVTMKGKSTKKQIIVGAHFDGDGYGDNGSGLALALAQIKTLARQKLPYTVKFIFFDGEELGMLGSTYYAENMTSWETKKTVLMINMDSLAFGDYCNIYGGAQNTSQREVTQVQGYRLAVKTARRLGMKVYTPKELNGYYKKHKSGPKVEDNAIYTNPWTFKNGSPADGKITSTVSPSTLDASDHVPFKKLHIPYLYFEATNWFAKGDNGYGAYTGYYETINDKIGDHGMFMNTKYDTKKNMQKYFPGRSKKHFKLYAKLLTSILKKPSLEKDKAFRY